MKIRKYMVFVAFATTIFIIGANSAEAGYAKIWDSKIPGGEPNGILFYQFTSLK